MAQSVKLADAVMDYARQESDRQSRSLAGQITHWINIGRAIEQSGSFDYQHIAAALDGKRSPDNLSAEEQEVWFDQFSAEMTQPSAEEKLFFANRSQLGQGVGLSDTGELVFEKDA
ncbi:hypothetical protein ROA7450_03825 [Roseovarius albus]|uniref:ParD-like antitoxin of type II bacterial toxin-antitoxin system n=1 Tax=Roseovarius albus TaxID=1247867 RepID=A0A1X7A492_9RHOB|nr:hypothetical protein [Roseovarius albus]SLN70200.1 hypothetical protein ROA7450_03825 [Roseovarius albus]